MALQQWRTRKTIFGWGMSTRSPSINLIVPTAWLTRPWRSRRRSWTIVGGFRTATRPQTRSWRVAYAPQSETWWTNSSTLSCRWIRSR